MHQDLLLELLKLGSGFEAELVGELGPDALVGGEGIGLAPRPVQRGDEQLPQTLLERVGRHRRFQLTDHLSEFAEMQPGGELGFEQ